MKYLPATDFCSKKQITNLRKLLSFLKSNVSETQFDMTYFSWSDKTSTALDPTEVKNECGTVCCLAGHGPLAGIAPLKDEEWSNYVDRVFTKSEQAYCFLFDSDWVDYQPTKEQAIFRLELFLTKGLPLSFSYPIMKYPLGTAHLFQREPRLGPHTFSDFKEQCLLGCHTLD